jgi:hypothetical protein
MAVQINVRTLIANHVTCFVCKYTCVSGIIMYICVSGMHASLVSLTHKCCVERRRRYMKKRAAEEAEALNDYEQYVQKRSQEIRDMDEFDR